MKKISLTLLVPLLIFIQSCIKDEYDLAKMKKPDWDPNIAVPLVYSSLSINDLLVKLDADSVIKIGPDNSIVLVFSTQLLSLKASDLFVLPNQQFTTPLTLGAEAAAINMVPVGSTYTISLSDTLDFDPGNGITVDSVFFKSGSINLDFSSDLQQNLQVVFSIPQARRNGMPVQQTINVNYGGFTPATGSGTINLAGCVVDMSGPVPQKIIINESIKVIKSTNNPSNPGDQISLDQTFSNMAFDKIFGFVAQQSISSVTKDTVSFELFDEVTPGIGTFILADPRIKVRITNSYGVPIKADFSQFDSYNSLGSITNVVTVPYPIPVNSPAVAQIGQSVQTTFTLDGSNSNLPAVINSKPKFIVYDVATQTNPPPGPFTQNFLIDTSLLKVDMDVELPLYGKASNFAFRDTIDFSIKRSGQIESMLVRTYISNGFPVDVDVQVYFTDSLYNVLDSLDTSDQILMPSAAVNPVTGKVTAPSARMNDFNFTPEKTANLGKTKKAIISGELETYMNGSVDVRFYADYRLEVKIGAQVQFNNIGLK